MGKKAKELNANLHHLQGWKPEDMTGRVRHDTLWHRALARWKPGTRVFVEFREARVRGEAEPSD